jgi:hypothetical protein
MSLPEAGGPTALLGPQDDEPVAPRPPSRSAEVALRVTGVLVSVLAAVVTGVLEVLLAPLRVGGVLIGVAALVAVAANAAIGWFAVTTVGRRWAVGPPWVVWTVLMFGAAGVRTREGDQLLAGDNWVALVMILLGSLTFALHAYRLILRGNAPRRSPL